MTILTIILGIFIILFEVSLREILIFQDVSLFFIIINLLYWHKRYKLALILGCVCSIFIDLFLQNHLGEILFSISIPFLILSIFDGLLRVETRLNKIIFTILGTATSIFFSTFLVNLAFLNEFVDIKVSLRQIFLSVIIQLILSFSLGRFFISNKKESKFL